MPKTWLCSGGDLPSTIGLYSNEQNIFRILRTCHNFLASLIFGMRKSKKLAHPNPRASTWAWPPPCGHHKWMAPK